MFNPAGLWVKLAMFPLDYGAQMTVLIEKRTACTGGTLIDGYDKRVHKMVPAHSAREKLAPNVNTSQKDEQPLQVMECASLHNERWKVHALLRVLKKSIDRSDFHRKTGQ
jgi:hypothetical protein